jgi:hypothetical protein
VNDGCLAHSRQTSALRALAWEWREWCRLHFVTDPETFFGANPRYMLDLLLDEKDGELWRNLNVARPGRPAAVVEFTSFGPEEAAAWLAERFAIAAGARLETRQRIGFA